MFGKLGRIFHFYERRELFLDFQKERSSLRPLLISLSRFIQIIVELRASPSSLRFTETPQRSFQPAACLCETVEPLTGGFLFSLLVLSQNHGQGLLTPPRGLFSPLASANRLYNILHRFCVSVPPGHQSAKPRMRICCSYCIFSSICFNI